MFFSFRKPFVLLLGVVATVATLSGFFFSSGDETTKVDSSTVFNFVAPSTPQSIQVSDVILTEGTGRNNSETTPSSLEPIFVSAGTLWDEKPEDVTSLMVYKIDSAGKPIIEVVENVDSVDDVLQVGLNAGEEAVVEWDLPVLVAQASSPETSIAETSPDVNASNVFINDPMRGNQWGLNGINVPGAWDRATGEGVVVAVVDTGVDPHPDLVANLLPGRDFIDNDFDAADPHGHGTHVAGIISAVAGNGIGVVGVAPDAKILPVRVLGPTGSGVASGVANGITWAADNGADVINLSLAGAGTSSAVNAAVTYATNKGIVLVAAAGNGGEAGLPPWPASHPSTIAVGATNSSGLIASFSTRGTHVDVSAPGMSILSPHKNGGYAYLSGTSMAAPHAAGVVALLREVNPTWRFDNMKNVLETTAVDAGVLGYDTSYGWGLIAASVSVNSLTDWVAPAPQLTVVAAGADTHVSYEAITTPGVKSYVFEANATPVVLAPGEVYVDSNRNLIPGEATYTVRAVSTTGSFSEIATKTVVVEPPPAPVVTGQANGSTVTLNATVSPTPSWWLVYRDGLLISTVAATPTGEITLNSQPAGVRSYTVVTENAIGVLSAPSQVASITILATPAAPTVSVVGKGIRVTYARVANATSHILYRNDEIIYQGTETLFTDIGQASTSGELRYTLVSLSATADRSNPVSRTFIVKPPAVPQVVATVNARVVTLGITMPQGNSVAPTGWQIWRDGTVIGTRAPSEMVVLTGQPLGTFAYTVEAISPTGISTASQPATVTTVLPAPTTFTAKISGYNVVLLSGAVAGATQYRIESVSPTGQTTVLSNTTARTFTDRNRLYTPGLWIYTVTPVDSRGLSGNTATTQLEIVAPAAPTVEPQVAGRTVTLVIDATQGSVTPTGWQIWRNGTLIATRAPDRTVVLAAQPLGTFNYTVRAISLTGISPPSVPVEVVTTLVAPTTLTATISGTNVVVTSGAVAGAVQYKFTRTGAQNETVTVATTSSRTFTDRDRLIAPGVWLYTVAPVDSRGIEGMTRTIQVAVSPQRTITVTLVP